MTKKGGLCEMREDHKESGDDKSLKLVSCFLVNSGFVKIEQGFKGNGYDLLAETSDGEIYLFNVKQRNFASGKYGDLTLDENDFNALQWAKHKFQSAGRNVKCVYIHFFTDNVMFATNDMNWGLLVRHCPATTRFGNNNYIQKRLKQKMQNEPDVKRTDLNNVSFDKMKMIY